MWRRPRRPCAPCSTRDQPSDGAWGRPAARRPSASGAGRVCSTGWTTPTRRRSPNAAGADDETQVVRTADLQRARARLAGHERVDALFDSDTYTGRPHPLSRVIVPEPLLAAWAPFARRRALKLNRREGFDSVITTSPPESAHLVGRALQRRGLAWAADVRDGWSFEPIRPGFPTAAQ